jgi:hypothetical protein
MLAETFVAISAAIALAMGIAHIHLTYFTRAFAARDAALEEKLNSVSPRLTANTTMKKIQTGFHVSHSMGVILFGLIYGYLALLHSTFLFQSTFLVVLGAVVLLTYIVLAKLYWFEKPLIGVSVAFAFYIAGVAVAYA